MYTTALFNNIHNLSRHSSLLTTTSSKMRFKHPLHLVATIATCASAFSVIPSTTTTRIISNISSSSSNTIANRGIATSPYHHRGPLPSITLPQITSTATIATRLYGSNSNSNNNSDKESILEKAANKIKSILPFGSKSSKNSKSQITTAKQKAKNSVSTSIETALKDAPLGIKLMGKLIAPILSNLVGSLAQSMEESQAQFDNVMKDVVYYLQIDPTAQSVFGSGGAIEVGSPFSQSSSTMSINGQMESRMQSSFEVKGVNGGGIATVSAVNGVIQSLLLNVNGRNIDIDTNAAKSANANANANDYDYSNNDDYSNGNGSTIVEDNYDSYKSKKATGGIGKNRNRNKGDIIDVEFVEKKVSK